ncbi:MAG: hypothetical protein QGG84_02905 [Rhodospirillales bacterium]|nr:hypothetical protein [Rhodospirillales bacterium]
MEIIQPPDWQRPKGYSNGIITTGKMFFVAGQVVELARVVFDVEELAAIARRIVD